MKADLHVHTSISDGVYAPKDVIKAAEEAGLNILSMTDHDSLLAYGDGLPSANLRLIVGCEFTTSHNGCEYHILGYFKAAPAAGFIRYIEGIADERRERMREAFRRMGARGIGLNFDDFLARQTSRVLTSAHVARYMTGIGVVASEKEAFQRFLKRGESVVPLPTTPMMHAIELINQAGGISIWAHPPLAELHHFVESAIEHGLQGIEVCNFWHPDADSIPFRHVAKKYSLLTTGGSDYHSDTHPCPLGTYYVSEDLIDRFLDRL